MGLMIVDTNIVIDLLNGEDDAREFIDSHLNEKLYLSVITVSEVYSGIKKQEAEVFEDLLTLFQLKSVDKSISVQAGLLRRKFMKSHGIEIPDAIIAATANDLNVPVATLDKKHFSVLTKNLIVPY